LGVIARPRAGHRLASPPSGRFTINRNSSQASGLIDWVPSGGLNTTKSVLLDYARGLVHVPASGFTIERFSEGILAYRSNNEAGVNMGVTHSSPVSTSFWLVLRTTPSFNRYIVGMGSYYASIGIDTSNVLFAAYITGPTLTIGQLYHVVLTLVGTSGSATGTLYIDGKLYSTLADQPGMTFGGTWLWDYSGGGYANIDACMADIRFYNRVLDANEVYQLYAPETRYDLYLPAAPRFWSVPAAAPPAGVAMPIFGNDDQLFGSIFGGAIVR